MRYAVTPAPDDLEYFLSQSNHETERIVSGMTSIIDANEERLLIIQKQKWFQRMWFTVSGKNKATVKEMEQNRDKLAAYSVQVLYKLMEEKRVSDPIISNLTVRLNEIHSSHLQLQSVMYDIIHKLNEKILSVDNYHNLITDIQNKKYDPEKIIASILVILSFLDKRTVSDKKLLDRIKETMGKNGFNFSQTINFIDFTEQILSLPEEYIGHVYLFTQNHTENKLIQYACCLIEQYHYVPKSIQKNIKDNVIKTAIGNSCLKGNERCYIVEFYDVIISSVIDKFAMLKETPAQKINLQQNLKVNFDNTKIEQLFQKSKEEARSFTSEWEFKVETDATYSLQRETHIYRRKKGDSEWVQFIKNVHTSDFNPFFIDGWLYYNRGEGNTCKTRIDSQELQPVKLSFRVGGAVVVGGKVFVVEKYYPYKGFAFTSGRLCRLELDTDRPIPIISYDIPSFLRSDLYSHEDWIYCIFSIEERSVIARINAENSKLEIIFKPNLINTNITIDKFDTVYQEIHFEEWGKKKVKDGWFFEKSEDFRNQHVINFDGTRA